MTTHEVSRGSGESHSPRGHVRESFRLKFQEHLREYLARHGSVTDGFHCAWQQTVNELPLSVSLQEQLYWELIDWAGSYEQFTNAHQVRLLRAWRDAAQTDLPPPPLSA